MAAPIRAPVPPQPPAVAPPPAPSRVIPKAAAAAAPAGVAHPAAVPATGRPLVVPGSVGPDNTGVYKHVHFYHSNYRTFPVPKGQKGCVDYYGFPYYATNSGQCCTTNNSGDEAVLVNPLVGGKYWKTMAGERKYGVKCDADTK